MSQAMIRYHCPALFISAPASGQGKTTVTAALARYHRRLGRVVRVFKTGPDFLDPMILEHASGAPVYSLDLFLGDEAHCRALLYAAAAEADIILIEGVMGLFDGTPSSADLACLLGIPILAVIDAQAMAQSFGALALGLASYRADVSLCGVLANRIGGATHAQLLAASLPSHLRWFGALPREAGFSLPERHLGVVQAAEVADLDARLERAADALGEAPLRLPEALCFAPPPPVEPLPSSLAGTCIAVARDAAFAFIYRNNLDVLRALGAKIVFFSPLDDADLPPCDALWLPGGYPELHMPRLAANHTMLAALRQHHEAGKPMLAECGGMLYLAESLCANNEECTALVGLLPCRFQMQERLVALGLQTVDLPEGSIRGHTFHYSTLIESRLGPLIQATNPNGGKGEAVYRVGRLTASYVHFYFSSNPLAVAKVFLP